MSPEPYPCGPAADDIDRPYWEGLRAGRLTVQRCQGCAQWLGGPRRICPSCYSFDLAWEPVAAEGSVHTWCRTHHPYMSELADLTPYTTVLVELPQADGVRVLGLLVGAPIPVSIGSTVTGVIEQPPNAAWPLLRWRVA